MTPTNGRNTSRIIAAIAVLRWISLLICWTTSDSGADTFVWWQTLNMATLGFSDMARDLVRPSFI